MNPIVALVLAALAPVAHAGHAGGNAGDLIPARTRIIREFINNDLRGITERYLRDLDTSRIDDARARDALEDMIGRGAVQDVRAAGYQLLDSCAHIGGEQGGGAYAGDVGGDICLSPRRLAENNASKAEIVALLVHEHAHHYGYVDANYAIHLAALRTLRLEQPGWTDGDAVVDGLPHMLVRRIVMARQRRAMRGGERDQAQVVVLGVLGGVLEPPSE